MFLFLNQSTLLSLVLHKDGDASFANLASLSSMVLRWALRSWGFELWRIFLICKFHLKCRILKKFQVILSIWFSSLGRCQYSFWTRTGMYFLNLSDWVRISVVWNTLIFIYLKSTAKIFSKQNSNGPYSELSNKILCILAAQGAAELCQIKVRGLKNTGFTW